ncbi:hypothetical protein JOM56_007268 [Amanita muscaria]
MALELLAAVVGAHLVVAVGEEEEEMATIMIRQTVTVATTTDTCPRIGVLVWRGISRAFSPYVFILLNFGNRRFAVEEFLPFLFPL